LTPGCIGTIYPAMGLLDRIRIRPPPAAPPEAIDLNERGEFEIAWPGGRVAIVPGFTLRDLCPCAACIEEGTGKKILDPSTIPLDIRAERIDPVGSYAIQVHWSDGHDTGLYTWDLLRAASGI
jgi:DUF971 family protein